MFDGCSTISLASWKSLFRIFVGELTLDNTDPIATMSLVAADWPAQSKIKCNIKSKIKKKAIIMLRSRFNQE